VSTDEPCLHRSIAHLEIRSSEESYDEAKAAAFWEQSAELVGLGHDGAFRRPDTAVPA
jgi:hypothetical protein